MMVGYVCIPSVSFVVGSVRLDRSIRCRRRVVVLCSRGGNSGGKVEVKGLEDGSEPSSSLPVRSGAVSYDSVVEGVRREVWSLSREQALNYLSGMSRENVRSQKVFNGLVHLFDELFGPNVAEEATRKLVEISGRKTSLATCNIILVVYARAGLLEDVLRTWKSMEGEGIQLDVVAYSIIVHAVGKSGDIDAAEKLVEEMLVRNVKPNVVTFNTLLSFLAERKQFDRFWKWRKLMREMDIPDTEVTSSTVVEAYIDEERVTEAEEYIRGLIRRKRPVTPEMLTSVMNAYASCGEVQGVERCRLLFENAGLELSECAFNVMLKAFWEVRDAEGMVRTSRLMRMSRVRPTAVTFTTLMKACASRGDIQRVRKCFQQMHRAGVYPDIIAYNTLLNALRIAGDLHGAKKCLGQMYREGVKPDVVSYNTVMKVFAERGRISQVNRFYQQMLDEGVAPTEFTFNTLIDAHGRVSDVDGAERMFSSLLQRGIKPSVVTFTSLIHAHARKGDFFVAMRIFRCMSETYQVAPNKITYSCLIHEMTKQGEIDQANALREEADRSGIQLPQSVR